MPEMNQAELPSEQRVRETAGTAWTEGDFQMTHVVTTTPHVVRTEPSCQGGRLPCDLPVVSHGSPLPSLRVHASPY